MAGKEKLKKKEEDPMHGGQTTIAFISLLVVGCAVIIAVVYWKNEFNLERPVIIETDCGNVEGKVFDEITDNNKHKYIYEFRNIPYALPPTGSRRWKPPKMLSEDKSKCWSGNLKYTIERKICVQQPTIYTINNTVTEDCLLLTVRTPALTKEEKLPVLFWIHGGGMMAGHNEVPGYFPDREFTASMNFVTVSVNYRLNAFGFLSLKELWIKSGPDESYGNYGILDLIMALKWVQNNIRNFGGNPLNVAIYGESGGASAVNCLIASPIAQGLFHKAISASGVTNIQQSHNKANEEFRRIITDSNCKRNSLTDTRQCLERLSKETIMQVVGDYPLKQAPYKLLFPVNEPVSGYPLAIIDPLVIPRSHIDIQSTVGTPLHILVSTTAEEAGAIPGGDKLRWPHLKFSTWDSLKEYLEPKIDTFKKGLYPVLHKIYTTRSKNKVTAMEISPQYIYHLITTDVLLSCATNFMAKKLAANQQFTVYRAVYSQPPTPHLYGGLKHAFHSWDSLLLFGAKHFPGDLPSNDAKMMSNIRNVFKQFINSDRDFKTRYKDKTMEFWNNTILTWEHDYHEEECKILSENGFTKFSWGNIGI